MRKTLVCSLLMAGLALAVAGCGPEDQKPMPGPGAEVRPLPDKPLAELGAALETLKADVQANNTEKAKKSAADCRRLGSAVVMKLEKKGTKLPKEQRNLLMDAIAKITEVRDGFQDLVEMMVSEEAEAGELAPLVAELEGKLSDAQGLYGPVLGDL